MSKTGVPYVLGLDIGSNSVGWAAIRLDAGRPAAILRSGVRIFGAGVSGNLEQGREESNAAARRQARLQRRQTDRRRRRIAKVYNLLSAWGLLPTARSASLRDAAISDLDRELARKHNQHSVLPYFLRARALDYALEPRELGRALYHLAQRRGFLSNRKVRRKNEKEEDRSAVKNAIMELSGRMISSGARTLGEFLATLNPHESRIRARYTHRSMYEDEFAAIWNAQAAHHPAILTDEHRAQLHGAMFFQRPLRKRKELIGECQLCPGEKRAPIWHPLSQRFRLLQAVNDLRLVDSGRGERPLQPEERAKLAAKLDEAAELSWAQIRKLLHISRNLKFTRELDGGEKRLIGNRTYAKLAAVFIDWKSMPESARLEAAEALAGNIPDSDLPAFARNRWNFGEDAARQFAEIELEPGYSRLSLKALERLLPRLQAGESFASAKRAEFPEIFETHKPLDSLPPVATAAPDIRNPAVLRALTELRKIVNALVRHYGKPEEIHIELARDLKRPPKERERRWKQMRSRENLNADAARYIEDNGGPAHPPQSEIEKVRLAFECNWICPYTGNGFNYASLANGSVQVEHIIPFSRSLDDSFANKTLCFAGENARKGNRTPREYYGHDVPRWEEILHRVQRFNSPAPVVAAKLRRFQMKEEEVNALLGNFSARQMNDTRYAARLAAKYVGALYGGISDSSHTRRVYATSGEVTAWLRNLWGLNRILDPEGKKNRDDHRHHAIDAIVVALTNSAWIQRLSDAAARARAVGRYRFSSIEDPWTDFRAAVAAEIAAMLVSHRPKRSIAGELHAATNYGKSGDKTTQRVRVDALSARDIDNIADDRVKQQVKLALENVGGDPAKLRDGFLPMLPNRNGPPVPIRRVRLRFNLKVCPLGKPGHLRHVACAEINHFEVFSVLGKAGKIKWDCAVVDKRKAACRLANKKPVVSRDHGPNPAPFASIAKGDILEIGPPEQRRLVVVKTLERDKRVGIVEIADARPIATENRNRERYTVNELMGKHKCRKVAITPLGDKIPCHD